MVDKIFLEMDDTGEDFFFSSAIDGALSEAQIELEQLNETIDSIKALKPECDKLDYMLAAGSGALCGIIDIFLVGKPGESPIGHITDRWFENRTKDFAKLCGWNGGREGASSSAIRFLENKFKIPYDQRGAGDAASDVFGLNPKNHHFKSLGHNPSLLGLFYSIMDQFTNSSHFVSDGQLIELVKADNYFELRGENIPAKLFSAFVNWFGHLFSDVSGSSGSQGRGAGIPSPLWTWTNDVIAIKDKMGLKTSRLDKTINELAEKIYLEGFDMRFQTAQTIPVILNELLVRLIYSIRRLIKYFSETSTGEKTLGELWQKCEPFSNPTVKRMLTVAHGTFCLVDLGDATVRGFTTGAGSFNPVEFFLRLNIAGLGRFTISLYGEVKRGIKGKSKGAFEEKRFLIREKLVVEYYIEGLKILADEYDDRKLITFVDDLQSSDLYIEAFNKSTVLAKKRHVPEEKVLETKQDIDNYFMGG